MENFVVSARKYRPATFDTVVGQSSITSTLKNAIKTQHLAQAFLFCGPRGVGKTTCARILAKTINCFDRTAEMEACDSCDSCNSFNEGASLNIYELDAASNNSVDDIRNLVDQVRIAPQIGSHKVYIIDEVHMLSNQAFNAFLKTLEEPPAHAIFILATTEKHKIIPTILSRCQIFDFNRIGIQDISMHLKNIAKKEGVEAEDEALHVIAEKADGALRDALSIFDQLVSFAGSSLSYQAVIENLNILDYDYYFKGTQYLLEGNIPQSLLLFNEILNRGFNGHLFINGLASHLRNLLVCKDESTLDLLEVGQSVKEKYREQSKNCPFPFLMKGLEICRQCDVQYKSSKNQRLLVELGLMQMASLLSEATEVAEKKKPRIKAPETGNAESNSRIESPPSIQPTESQANKAIEKEKTRESDLPEKKPIENNPPENPSLAATPRSKPQALGRSLKSKTSSLSISSLTKKEEVSEEEKIAFSSELRDEFDLEKLQVVWNKMCEWIKSKGEEGSSIVYAALSTHQAIIEPGHIIRLKVDNKSQLEEMTLARTDLHDYLRKALRNGAIELELEILKNKKEKKAYTQEEKFAKLAEKNPSLLQLKKELDLDFF